VLIPDFFKERLSATINAAHDLHSQDAEGFVVDRLTDRRSSSAAPSGRWARRRERSRLLFDRAMKNSWKSRRRPRNDLTIVACWTTSALLSRSTISWFRITLSICGSSIHLALVSLAA